jgi:H/ACA ribonucleoprotein complex subunit 2
MIKIAQPLASQNLSENILKVTKKRILDKTIITGVKACQKKILSADCKGLMVFSASVSPMDIITHIPILCEKKEIPYVFVENNDWINGFTCAFLTSDVDELISEIKKLN